ncbi:type II toxin-antitoxin system Phd/YefM family antitoxin [Bauldia sp.]|uniref:type II toxin-antitoxin system Phd/YefM family antitoxin n=1 Tax=Bauldia sp. TaxID=2575872 RepID=UPI003BA9F713
MTTWQIQKAKARFSELLEQVSRDGPQTITKHGKPTAVVVSITDYEALRRQRPSLVDYLKSGPSFEGVDLERSKDTGRAVDL